MNNQSELDVLTRALKRERARRESAETLLEEKSRALFESYQSLKDAHEALQENQRQLVQSEKMASIGVLSAGVAHEINTPLGFLMANTNTLAEYICVVDSMFDSFQAYIEKTEKDEQLSHQHQLLTAEVEERELTFILEDAKDLIQESLQGIDHVSETVSALQLFSHSPHTDQCLVELNECVSAAYRLLESTLNDVPSVTIELTDEVVPIIGRHDQIAHAITALLLNAIYEVNSKDSGEIHVSTLMHEQQAIVRVQDNGSGIDLSEREQIFTPFYTTKPVGVGKGLGLSIAFNIMEEHGGHINIDNAKFGGAKFELCFPIHRNS